MLGRRVAIAIIADVVVGIYAAAAAEPTAVAAAVDTEAVARIAAVHVCFVEQNSMVDLIYCCASTSCCLKGFFLEGIWNGYEVTICKCLFFSSPSHAT